MKRILKYAFAFLGWILAIVGTLYGYNHAAGKEKVLIAQLNTAKAVKQNPVSTFVDKDGREHVKFPDGTVSKLPEDKDKQSEYMYLRDSIISPADATSKNNIILESVVKVDSRTTGSVSKAVLDSLPAQKSIQLDRWMTLFPDREGGFKYQIDQTMNNARYIQKSGLFNLKRTPYISFFSDNPNAKITGFSKYDYPLPKVQPLLKVYAEAEYDFPNREQRTDLGASFRIGKFEVIGYGRVGYIQDRTLPNSDFNTKAFIPSYGVKLRYNIIEL